MLASPPGRRKQVELVIIVVKSEIHCSKIAERLKNHLDFSISALSADISEGINWLLDGSGGGQFIGCLRTKAGCCDLTIGATVAVAVKLLLGSSSNGCPYVQPSPLLEDETRR